MYRGLSGIAVVPVLNEETKIGHVLRRTPRAVVDEVLVVHPTSPASWARKCCRWAVWPAWERPCEPATLWRHARLRCGGGDGRQQQSPRSCTRAGAAESAPGAAAPATPARRSSRRQRRPELGVQGGKGHRLGDLRSSRARVQLRGDVAASSRAWSEDREPR